MNRQPFQRTLLSTAIAGGLLTLSPLLLAADEATDKTPEAQTAELQVAETKKKTGFQVEEVVVTARHRTENLQDVPISITAVGAADITQLGATNLDDLNSVVPNFKMKGGLLPEITIRGRENTTETIGTESGVGVYVNGVLRSRQSTNVDLADVERVEVLRGPQGTLYGKNTITGAVNITLKKPGEEFKGGVKTRLGNFGRQDLGMAVEGPIAKDLTGRLTLASQKSDGYIQNVITGNNVGGDESLSAQLQLAFTPTDQLSIDLEMNMLKVNMARKQESYFGPQTNPDHMASLVRLGELTELETTFANLPLDQPYKIALNSEAIGEQKSYGGSLTAVYDAETGHALTSITSLQNSEGGVENNDDDFLPAPLLSVGFSENQAGFSQEFRLASPGGEFIDWQLGLYYDNQDMAALLESTPTKHTLADLANLDLVNGILATAGGFNAEVETESMAVFGSMDINLTDKLTLTLGARYTEESKDARYVQPEGAFCLSGVDTTAVGLLPAAANIVIDTIDGAYKPLGITNACGFPQYQLEDEEFTTDQFNPAVNVSYIASEEVTLYAKVAEGYKSGGFNIGRLRPASQNINHKVPTGLGPLERQLLGPLFLSGSVSEPPENITIEDEEVLSQEIGAKFSLLDRRLTLNLAAFYDEYENMQVKVVIDEDELLDNVAEALITGAEIDFNYLLNENWRFMGSYGYVDTELTGVPESDAINFDPEVGDEFGSAPLWTSSFSVDYSLYLDSYGSLSARLGYTTEYRDVEDWKARINWLDSTENITVSLWVNNIKDEQRKRYATRKRIGLEYQVMEAQEPRTYGVDLTYKF